MAAGLEDWNKMVGLGKVRVEDLYDLEMGTGRKSRQQQDATELGMSLAGGKGGRSVVNLPASLARMARRFPRNACWISGLV